MRISGATKIYGVIGDPIEHSLSPIIQNAAFEAAGLDSTFLAFKVKSAEVERAINGMRGLGIQGINVTMPHKNEVIKFLDGVEENARQLNAVNTIKNDKGKLYGFNTDGVGALNALRENGFDPKGKKVALLGAGGAARAIAYAIARETEELAIVNRTLNSAAELANMIYQNFNSKVCAYTLSPLAIKGTLSEAELLINTSSVGMKPNEARSPVNKRWLRSDLAVMDIVYNPVETKLAKEAKSAGAKVISGVEMLIYQGAASFEIWTGKKAPVEVMREAALNQLRKVQKG